MASLENKLEAGNNVGIEATKGENVMGKFMIKCFFLITVLLFGVLIGMQQANVGMKKMRGYEDTSLQGAFQLTNNESGEVEASVLGTKVTSHDIEEKQKKLEEVEAFNFFSSIGKSIGETVKIMFEKLLLAVSNGIEGILEMLTS